MMLRLNDPDFDVYGRPRRFSSLGKNKKTQNKMTLPVEVEYFEPTAEAKEDWRPFKLVSDSRGVAYTIKAQMRWVDIVRHVLKDNTSSSNLAKLVRGECKSINGWRCELL
jgi:hypothetical protein